VDLIIARLEERIRHFEMDPVGGISAPSVGQQHRKFGFLKRLVEAHKAYEGKAGLRRKSSELHRIVNGFVVHFITQSERDIQPLNVEHGRNPEAKNYWDGREPDALRHAKLPGLFHVAASYNHLRQSSRVRGATSAAKFHAVGELVRVCIDTFKEEYPKLNLPHPTRASIYNDHFEAISLALSMRKS